MIKTAKTSTAAIIFVTIYFIFIIFISLFKGITLYNLDFNKIKIKSIFIKLDKKITLKIKNLTIYTTKNYKKEAFNLHEIFYILTKFLPFFKQIKIDNIYQNNFLIVKKFYLNKNNFTLTSKNLQAKGHFKIYKKYSVTFLNTLKLKNYILKNVSIFSYYNKNYVFINIKAYLKKNPLFLAIKADNHYIYYSIQTNKLTINFKNFKLNLLNLLANGKINTFFTYFDSTFNLKYLKLTYPLFSIYAYNIKGNNKNYIINLHAKNSFIKYPKYFNKLKLNNLFLSYDYNHNSLTTFTKNIQLKYKNYKLTANNITLNYQLFNNNFFLHGTNLKVNNDINLSSKEFLISKLPKLYFYFSNNNLTNKYFDLKNKILKGNKKLATLSNIIGKILGFDTNIYSPKINLIKKYAVSNKIFFNKILLSNTKFNFNKKPFILTSSTNTLFNKNIKEILKKFNINIPFIQTKGKNHLKIKTYISNKLQNIVYDVNSTNSTFSFNNDINFSYLKLFVKGDINFTNISIKNFQSFYKDINVSFDANTTVNIKEKYINSFAFIKQLNIDKYLNIKNFNEKIVINLKNNFIYLLNSFVFINLNNKTIYLYYLKKLLKYSLFNKIFNNGEVLIKLFNKKIYIQADATLKYPLILNQKNPYKINIESTLKHNNITFENKYIKTKIINFKKIISNLNNLDLNITSLLKIINITKNIISTTNSTSNKLIKVFIKSKNTNFIYKNHKFLTQKATLNINKEINFSAVYKQSHLIGYTKNNYLLIEGKNYNKEVLSPLLNFFNHFNSINLDFILVKSPENFYTGKIYIKKGTIKDLGALNNIIAFINTIPALLTLHSPGFSSKGYKIKTGYINYLYYKDILYFKQIKIDGINLDFNGKGYINLKKNYIKMKIHAIIKIKFKKIPILGKALSYILFGKDGYLHINIFIKGDLNNPKILKDFGGGIIESPLTLFKRIITLPFNIF